MAYHYVIHANAQKEYEVSVQWYLKKSLSAANGFVKAVKNAIKLICRNPHIWRNDYKHFHEFSLKKYPFTIVYFIDEPRKTVVIAAIFHQKKSPEKKYRK